MERTVERLETAVMKEDRERKEQEANALRRAEAEAKAEENRKRREADRKEERGKSPSSSRTNKLEGLERRKAFLEDTLRIEKAREALADARKAGVVIESSKPVSRLLQGK